MPRFLRAALRTLRRRPVLSVAIALTVAAAIAATTIAFAVVRGVLLQPLPYAEPDRLVAVWETFLDRGVDRNVTSPANYLAWREQLLSFDRLAAIIATGTALTGDGEPERVGAMIASAAYFDAVGAVPVVGRLYTEQDDADGAPGVVVISEGLWTRRYGADPSIVGRSIQLNGSPFEVIGVLPERFDFAPRYTFSSTGARDVWFPPRFDAAAREWGGRYLQVIGRLAPGATLAQAADEATALSDRLRRLNPDRQEGWGIRLVPLQAEVVGDVRTTVLIIFGAVLFVLLIACANVATLLLTRASERQQEIAVRAALGAGRGILVRQLLTESVVLTGLGGLVGLALAVWGVAALIASAPTLPRLDAIRIDPLVILFAFLVTGGAALLIGALPARQLTGPGLATWLTQRLNSARREAHRARNVLAGAQVALSFILLVGAGLLIRSLANRLGADLGFDVAGTVTAEVALPGQGYATAAEREVFFEQLAAGVQRLPGVERASLASIVPMSGDGQGTGFRPLDRPPPAPGQGPSADVRFVRYDYHRTMGIALRAGRYLDETDRAGAPVSVLINETGARQIWPGRNAVGQRIEMAWGDTVVAEVRGVVADVRLDDPDQPASGPTLYWDYRQVGQPARMVVVARGANPAGLAAGIRGAVRELDPNLPVYNVRTMESLLDLSVARDRFTTVALGLFALLALLLAVLGVYGVMACATQQREREIGIRLALGADRGAVVRMVLSEGARVLVPALAVGGLGAFGLSRFLQSLVFEVKPGDPATFAAVGLGLGLAGLVACWLPARRAGGIDPVEAIRAE